MASIRDIYSGDTLSAADLPAGVQVPVVIEAVRAVHFDDGNKLELHFRGKRKVLMCNKTNAMRIADQHGDDYTTWPGKAIFLQRDVTHFQGREVECVRVARQPVARPASQLPPVAQAAAQSPVQHLAEFEAERQRAIEHQNEGSFPF
jgi:hypothetical protein